MIVFPKGDHNRYMCAVCGADFGLPESAVRCEDGHAEGPTSPLTDAAQHKCDPPAGVVAAVQAQLDRDKSPPYCTVAEHAHTAPELLGAARKHMEDRAATYDQPEGERSMARTVEAFNAVTGHTLAESEGWLLLALLKTVRNAARDVPHRDSLEDFIAYAALMAEAALRGD